MKQKKTIIATVFSIMGAIALLSLTGCSATDEYHNKRHVDTVEKDIGAIHKDIDSVLGLDEPSPLIEKE